jgi:hypothetical protein
MIVRKVAATLFAALALTFSGISLASVASAATVSVATGHGVPDATLIDA